MTANLNRLSIPWSGERPIEDIWNQINESREYAAAHDPITELAATRLTTVTFEDSGLFTAPLILWRGKPVAEQTLDNMIVHFNAADKERRRTLTTSQAGFQAITIPRTTASTASPLPGWHYCWSHGLNKTHPSSGCTYTKPGHVTTATLDDHHGGSYFIQSNTNRSNDTRRPDNSNDRRTDQRTMPTKTAAVSTITAPSAT